MVDQNQYSENIDNFAICIWAINDLISISLDSVSIIIFRNRTFRR